MSTASHLPGRRVCPHEVSRGSQSRAPRQSHPDAVGSQIVSLARRQVGGAVAHPLDDAVGPHVGQGSVDRGVRLAENERQFRRIDERRSAEGVQQLST